jgi:hypothetical protein
MSIYVQGLLWVAGIGLAAGGLAWLVRRSGGAQGFVDNNEAAGQVFTLVGGLQAVLLAFVLISLFDGVSAAEDSSYREADSLVAVAWAAQELPTGDEVTAEARAYAREVIDTEWTTMRDGGEVAGKGWVELEGLRTAISSAQAGDEWAVDRKTEAIDQLWTVYQERQSRLNTASGGGINSVVWFALVAGGIMAVGLPILFGGPKTATHILIVAILAGTMTMLLFATHQLQNPYGGGAQVSPDAFQSALERLR